MRGKGKRILLGLIAAAGILGEASPVEKEMTVRQRLWIWGHPAGVYNESYLRPLNLTSSISVVTVSAVLLWLTDSTIDCARSAT